MIAVLAPESRGRQELGNLQLPSPRNPFEHDLFPILPTRGIHCGWKKGWLTVLRLEEGLARPFPGGLPLGVIPGTKSVSMILNLSVLVPPPPLAVEERTDFPGYLFFPNESYARH